MSKPVPPRHWPRLQRAHGCMRSMCSTVLGVGGSAHFGGGRKAAQEGADGREFLRSGGDQHQAAHHRAVALFPTSFTFFSSRSLFNAYAVAATRPPVASTTSPILAPLRDFKNARMLAGVAVARLAAL